MTHSAPRQLKIAIVGAGPAGLAQIIHLRRLNGIDLSVFDGATELKEVGAGIALNENTWRHLKLLGVADKIDQYFNRGDGSKVDVENRNGRTGKIINTRYQSVDPNQPARVRIERYKLQNALLSAVPEGLIQLGKKLVGLEEGSDGVKITFKDGTIAGPFDLVIGADGIRSVVRQHAFPDHKLTYTGKVAFRVLIPQSAVAHIPGISELHGAAFWHTKKTHVYTNPLDNGLFEIATRAIVDDEEGKKVSWGQVVPREHVVGHYSDYTEILRKIIEVPDTWLEFAMFGGPRLESVIRNGRIALIGDASHPLSGAFGSGAAFAFEDAYVLSQAIGEVLRDGRPLASALAVYDAIRAPHYKALYEILDGNADSAKEVAAAHPEFDDDEFVEEIVSKGLGKNTQWIYKYDVTKVWNNRCRASPTDVPVLANEVAGLRTITAAA